MKNLFSILILFLCFSGFSQEKNNTLKERLNRGETIFKFNDKIESSNEEVIKIWFGDNRVFYFKLIKGEIVKKQFMQFVDMFATCDTFPIPTKNTYILEIGNDTAKTIVNAFHNTKFKKLRPMDKIKNWSFVCDGMEYYYEITKNDFSDIFNYSGLVYEKSFGKNKQFQIRENKKIIKLNKTIYSYFNLNEINDIFFTSLENGCYSDNQINFKVLDGKILPFNY